MVVPSATCSQMRRIRVSFLRLGHFTMNISPVSLQMPVKCSWWSSKIRRREKLPLSQNESVRFKLIRQLSFNLLVRYVEKNWLNANIKVQFIFSDRNSFALLLILLDDEHKRLFAKSIVVIYLRVSTHYAVHVLSHICGCQRGT